MFREEQREQDNSGDLAERRPGDRELADGSLGGAGVLEDRDDQSERRGNEDDADQQWALDHAGGVQDDADDQSERDADSQPETCLSRPAASKVTDVYFEAGQEQQEGQADRRPQPYGRVRVDATQHGRP